ncbi:holo-ACP synthase [Buchnera aphidicola str. APS (Acyrthosiphon pisum)]|uniref:Holo-[acyl-carrier-protein] synthase n=3 Tax=Buchnera aphidicola TaxID=9 RepID=ACPS_BUCAI|nr:holo-ACP synthase [Buchnera aphidicola]B8D7F3.1 RecName: Full=Holo-[acyl-carrier-protein] synthase; Short=Holo-ACP synthase; AltName: Full=4'-phosphopantetheinyl transferase AcpS [Buchnera aphidicola str. Tuc7 (Acyrthosiphon pisum)]B8D949.1 RecName: Full=Holo-[acyl-carrier-protein] synthase; Short=Holo-ACP synthase; AltName: Full=4'-phosphopantetheinyl transferase AcpS [Buchnera aphidicola str. 5A (Acyrthosiphon pisum)]P57344.1 RecName: Full=Holo-[acyl-carrier-protein] synthase; Short=Holo-AC
MSIIGIGIDFVEILRIKNIFLKYGDKFARKILSTEEWKKYILIDDSISFLAKKFVAKEAASKALGTGINHQITFNQLEFYKNKSGKPKLRFLKHALKKSKEIQCKSIHVSISDQKLYAYALVILEN